MDNLVVQIPTLDLGHLSAQTFGDQLLERQLLTMFRTQAGQIMSDLQNAVSLSGQVRADRAHLLKGSALAIGATRVAVMAAAYESLIISANHGSAVNALGELAMAVTDAFAAIDRHIGPF